MLRDAAKAWLDTECAKDDHAEYAEERDYSCGDMLDAFAAGTSLAREPTEKMLEQGLMYLTGADPEALRAAWRIMVDMSAAALSQPVSGVE